ncbi:hypothetical protein RB595_000044 [Gaeumannomyces hyphopodioides]
MLPSTVFPFLIISSSALGGLFSLCISDPPLLLVAGQSKIQAINYSPARRDCRAAIHFANLAFPPITYLYSSGSCHFGSENASFQVPIGAPSGDAFVTWECGAVTHTCVRAVISEGRGTPKPPSLLDGAISCERWPKRNKTSSLAPSISSIDDGISSNKPPSSSTVRRSTLAQGSFSILSSTSKGIVAPTSFGSVTSSSLPVPSREGQPISGSGASNSAERSTGGDGFIQTLVK